VTEFQRLLISDAFTPYIIKTCLVSSMICMLMESW